MSISVVLYCYKSDAYLEHCLATLQSQTIEFELIVVTDGYYVDTKIKQYFPEAQIVNVRKPLGRLYCFFLGLTVGNNRYCVFQNAWDFNSIDRLKFQYSLLTTLKLPACVSNYKSLGKAGVRDECEYEKEIRNLIDQQICNYSPVVFPISTIMFDRTCFDIASFWQILENGYNKQSTEALLQQHILSKLFCVSNKKLLTINQREDVVCFEKDQAELLAKYLELDE